MKIAYLGLDFMLPVLETLLREDVQVMELFTCPTDNVTEFNTGIIAAAEARQIPWTTQRLSEADLARLEEAGCQLVVCAGYYYRIPIPPTLPMVNFHPAPLPMYRGGWPMPIILLKGLPLGGVTLHKMAPAFDMGDILLEETFPIRPEETLVSYMEQVYAKVPEMARRLVRDLPGLLAGAQPQGEGLYWPIPTEADWTVTSEMDVEQADRILRAFYGYECIYQGGGRRFELIGGRALPGPNTGQPFPVQGGYLQAERIREL